LPFGNPPTDAQETMDARTSRFTDRVAALFEYDGLPPIAGRIFALLLLSEEARSLDQLSGELGVSKASASTNTRLLARFGLIEPVRRPGSRRDYYRTVDDLFERSMAVRLDRWREFTDVIGEGRSLPLPTPEVRERLERYEGALSYMADAIVRAMIRWRAVPARRFARTGSGR
jgi:predicted transcriptional regulator